MPNLNEYYQLLQNEEPPLSNDALREMIASAVERADKEALAAPQATESVRRSRLNGTGMVIGSAAIIALTFWGFNYFQSQQSSAPQVHREAVQGEKSEVGRTGITTTTQESTSRSLDTQYKAQQTDQFLQPSFADIGHKTRPQTKDDITATTADTITKNTTAQTAVLPADSLLPEDFRSWEMPSDLAWAVAERRYNDALGILDSLLLRKQALPNTKFNLLCLRGHLHKIMGSANASIADYSSALDMHESSELYMLRGIQYRTASQHQEALQDFTNAIRLNPYNAQAVLMRGTTAHKLGRLQEACSDWLAAAEMGNTVADSMLKEKCNPTVIQTIRTAQTKRLQAIKTLALLLERTKESIGKVPSSNSSVPSLQSAVEALVKKISSSFCDIPTVLKGETSTHCAFQAIHTIAVELQDDSLAAMVNPVIQKKNNYSGSLNSQLNNTRTNAQNDAISPSYFDMEVLTSMAKNNPRLQQRTHNYLMKTTPRYSSQMRENSSAAQNQTLTPEILHNIIQAIENYCRATYPEMVAQAPSSVKTESKVQPLPPSAQQDTARTSQTTMSTPDSRKDEATALAPSAPQTTPKSTITAAPPTEKPSWQYGKRIYQQQYSLLDQLTQIALSQVGVKTTFSQLFAPCTLSAALAGKSSSDCVLSLLEQQAVQIQDSTLQAYAVLAHRYWNYQMPTTPQVSEPSTPSDTYKSIPVSTLPRTLESAKNPVHEELVVRMIEMPKSTSEPTKPNDASVHLYRQVLLNIQKHTWKVIDAIEDTTVSRQNTERESNVTKDFGDMPLWFQELVQTRRFAFAQNIIDSMLTQESRAPELYTLRGDMSKSMDSVATSIADYTQALSLQESSALYMLRGTQYFTADKRQEAYNDFTSAMRLDPQNYQAVYMRGAAAYNLKRFEEACDDWYLAAQMGHPFADSVLEQRCASFMPKYVRTAIAEKKQQVKIMLLLLEQINSRGISWNTQKLDSLSYKSLEVNCTMENALDGSISTACALHLLYTMTLNLHDDIATDLVKRLAERTQRFAISSPDATASPNFDQTMRSIDYNKQIVDMVSNINSTPRAYERVQSLQDLQRLQSQAMNRRTENTFRNTTPQSSHGHVARIVEQMKKYLLEQYAEFIDVK